eukprot:TRINITY_DN4113_c0_g5_i1.p1 TRINITY_DN4113_c0_g5~~TRINITY_DN4113_c0_g5_i1.p1  ORF type:complete len:384 (-),score=101.07 TRINITY_DN4113_c0_g5_i1:57-1208(-)
MAQDSTAQRVLLDWSNSSFRFGSDVVGDWSIAAERVVAGQEFKHDELGLARKLIGGGHDDLAYPVKDGIVLDWEVMSETIRSCFAKQGLAITKTPLSIGDTVMDSDSNRERMAEIMFESFEAPSVQIACREWYKALASNRVDLSTNENFASLSIGEGNTCAVRIAGANVMWGDCITAPVGGDSITLYLKQLLNEKAQGDPIDFLSAEKIKRDSCYYPIRNKWEETLEQFEENKETDLYKFAKSDGSGGLTVGKERILVSRTLFEPTLFTNQVNIAEMFVKVTKKCVAERMSFIYANLSSFGKGGRLSQKPISGRVASDFNTKLVNEMYEFLSPTMKVNVHPKPYKAYEGQQLALQCCPESNVVTKQMFQENGSQVFRTESRKA